LCLFVSVCVVSSRLFLPDSHERWQRQATATVKNDTNGH
jgi:hypothetical protein